MGSTCFLRPLPLSHLSIFPSPARKKKPTAYACSHRTEDDDNFSSSAGSHFQRRRAVLFGATFVPPLLLLQLEAAADVKRVRLVLKRRTEGVEDNDATTTQENLKAEEVSSQRGPPDPFSLLNGLGIFTSGTLGALYALGQKEKQTADAAVESMMNSLKEKEADILTLEQRYKAKAMKEQEERIKEMKKSDDDKWSLMNQLNLLNTTVYGLGQDLKREKHLADELKLEKNSILAMLSKAEEHRRTLEGNLKEKVHLADELKLEKNSILAMLSKAEEHCRTLEENQKEKAHLVENLGERISLLSSELKANEENLRGISSNLANKELEFINMNSTYRDTKDGLLKAQMEIEELNNHILGSQIDLESKIAEITELNSAISTLVSEKDHDARKLAAVEKELIDLASASDGRAAADAKLLGDAQNELCLLNEQLKHCQKVSAELSRIQAEHSEERTSLQSSLDDAIGKELVLVGEVSSVKALLEKTTEELQKAYEELASLQENSNSLRNELVDVYNKAESAANDLKKEKEVVSSLNKDVEALEKQLEESTRSIDQMNQKALMLSRDLEVANSQISTLEKEKEALYGSFVEQKKASKEAQQNLEDAYDLVIRLGKERENMNKLSRMLEELASSSVKYDTDEEEPDLSTETHC